MKPVCIAVAAFFTIAAISCASSVVACETVVSWKAPLSGRTLIPAVDTPAAGLASFDFSLDRPQATITMDSSGLTDVTEIDLCHGFVGSSGPTIACIYHASDGPLTAHWVKTIDVSDVPANPALHIRTFADFAVAIINGGVYMQICTKAHPAGEMRGQVSMVKQLVYSEKDDGSGHDPRLHARHADARAQSPTAVHQGSL